MAVHRIKRPRLPDEYQEVEWIQSDGNQYINTGIKSSQGFYFNSLTIISTGFYDVYVGCDDGRDGVSCFWLRENDNTATICTGVGDVTSYSYANYNHIYNANIGQSYKVEYDKPSNTFRINGTRITITNEIIGLKPTTLDIYMFGCNQNGTFGRGSKIRVGGYAGIYTSSGDYYFYPCYRKSDGIIGMYCPQNATFYQNQGSGTFTKGADINTYVTMNNLNYGSNSVHLAKYGNDCIWQDEYEVTVEHEKESSLYTYLNGYSLTSTAYPCQNGCMTTSETGENITGSISANFGFRNTATFSVVSNNSSDTSSTSWNISSITAPSIDGGTNTSLNIKNNNSFVVTCYYGTSSGSTTYSTSISANSTSTISGLTSGTTYYFFFIANRTGTITYKQRKSRINGGAYQKNPSISFVVNGDTTIELESATITSTEATSGTISSSVTSGVPSSASWHTMWTGSVTKVAISKSTISDTLSGFSGLIVGLPVRFTCKFGNSSTITCVVSSQSLPSTITSSQFSTTVTISKLSVSDSSTISWTRKASATNTRTLYITKMEQYY